MHDVARFRCSLVFMLPMHGAEQQQGRCIVIIAMGLLDHNWFCSQTDRLIYHALTIHWPESWLCGNTLMVMTHNKFLLTPFKGTISLNQVLVCITHQWSSGPQKSISSNSVYHRCIWHQSCNRKIPYAPTHCLYHQSTATFDWPQMFASC